MGWIMKIVGVLTGFIPFLSTITNAIQSITKQIVDLRVEAVRAGTEEKKIQAEEDIKVLEAQRDILIKQTDRSEHITALTRLGFAVPVAVVIWKVLVWDKVIGSIMGCSGITTGRLECDKFTTDPLDPNLWWVVFSALCFYFTQNLATIWKRPV